MAIDLASKEQGEILALHMLEVPPAIIGESTVPPEHIVQLIRYNQKRFDQLLSTLDTKGVKVTPIIKHYKVFAEVNEVAAEHDADIVIMGSNGSDGLEELFI